MKTYVKKRKYGVHQIITFIVRFYACQQTKAKKARLTVKVKGRKYET